MLSESVERFARCPRTKRQSKGEGQLSLDRLLKTYGRLLAAEGPPTRGDLSERRELEGKIFRSEEWPRIAESVRVRWLLPADVEADDIAQAMRIGLHRALGDWNPTKWGFVPFAKFRMHSAAYRFVQQAREARSPKDREGNFLRCISSLATDADDPRVDADAWAAPEVDHAASRYGKEVLAMKLRELDTPSAVAVLAFCHHESFDRAAESLAFDRFFRARTGLRKLDQIRAFVVDAAERAAGWRGGVVAESADGYGR